MSLTLFENVSIIRHVFEIFDVPFELIPDVSNIFYGFPSGKKLIDIDGKFIANASVLFHKFSLYPLQIKEYHISF